VAGLLMAEPTVDADWRNAMRHLRLPGVGVDGQAKLEVARVLLVGAGGSGSPAAFCSRGGRRPLRIADDVVDRSNQRQILHNEARIGLPSRVGGGRCPRQPHVGRSCATVTANTMPV
jgi:molybdopterin/thiamine biosynthesis adenylyltransferase